MKVTMILFPVAYNRINVLAVNIDHQQDLWKRHYRTRGEVIAGLEQTGMVTASEADELETNLNFVRGCPIFKGFVEREDLEDAGFSPIAPEKTN